MSIQKKLFLVASIVLAFSFIACKSTPEPEPVPAPEPPAKVEEKKPEPKPVEKPVEVKDYTETNTAAFEKVNESRDEAINYGGNEDNEEGFAVAEAKLAKLKESEKDSTVDLTNDLEDLAYRYDALKNYSIAIAKEEEIAENDFISYAQELYDEADNILTELSWTETNEAKTGKELFDMSVKAIDLFDQVLLTAYRAEAKAARVDALDMKKKADEVKASVSRTADYKAAVELLKSADNSYVLKDPETALLDYEESAELFAELYGQILEARAKASNAIEEAKKRVAESKAAAEKADAVTPLEETEVAGIEAEDAVLLEEDTFNDEDKAAIDVAETLEEGEE